MTLRWYSVSVLSNYERRVAESVREQAEKLGLGEQIAQVIVPTEEIVEVRRGKKVKSERRFMPGYVLVEMELSDKAYHLVTSTNHVMGFLGPQGRPTPMRKDEVDRIITRSEVGDDKVRVIMNFEIGEKISVLEGPFEGFNGFVVEVDSERERLKVSVSIFGRETPVDLEFGQVKKNI